MIRLSSIVAIAVLGVAGCVETAGTRVAIDTRTGDASVLECSPRLANRVKIVRVTYGYASEGIARATVTLASDTHYRQELQARMVWMDGEGNETDADDKPFRAIVLDGKDQTTFTGVAPNSKAVKAKLLLRETDTAQ